MSQSCLILMPVEIIHAHFFFSFTVYLLSKLMGFIIEVFSSVLYTLNTFNAHYTFSVLPPCGQSSCFQMLPLFLRVKTCSIVSIYILRLQATCLLYLFFKMQFVVATRSILSAMWLTYYISLTVLFSTKSLLRPIQLVGYLCK